MQRGRPFVQMKVIYTCLYLRILTFLQTIGYRVTDLVLSEALDRAATGKIGSNTVTSLPYFETFHSFGSFLIGFVDVGVSLYYSSATCILLFCF